MLCFGTTRRVALLTMLYFCMRVTLLTMLCFCTRVALLTMLCFGAARRVALISYVEAEAAHCCEAGHGVAAVYGVACVGDVVEGGEDGEVTDDVVVDL